MSLQRIYILFLSIAMMLPICAQEHDTQRNIYNDAMENYSIGRLEQAQQLLSENINRFNGSTKESAYRLLALCALGMDKNEEAEHYTTLLLRENPYYSTTVDDPARFVDIVKHIKSGMESTITTASNQAEKLSEVPVPVTLITDEMIRACSGRNLKEVLLAYVPGMNNVDSNDDINIAMRGIYNNSQEKILIMLNGHRLNSYSTNTASPDFSLSLEKVKQIEVLRGPASSLYGGVALTAVVNIITKDGADVDGLRLKVGYGNYNQKRADIVFGKRYYDLDVLLWGSLYHANGERIYVPREETGLKLYGGDIIVGGTGNKPNFDMGFTLKWKSLSFTYDTHFSQIISPFTISTTFLPYDWDKYTTFNGIKPSFATKSHHLDLTYRAKVGKRLHLQGAVMYDNSDMTHYQVISDSAISISIPGLSGALGSVFKGLDGVFRYINGQEATLSAEARGDFNYVNTEHHQGLLTFGAQFSYFKLDDVRYALGVMYNLPIESNDVVAIAKGNEKSMNGFIQLKHQWRNFILNAGIRYDHKVHYDGKSINVLSPRVAAIFLQKKWNAKFSYSKSFVDAPYLYRKINEFIPEYTGDSIKGYSLGAETMHSYQLTLSGTDWVEGLNLELNGFYNRAQDLIYAGLLTYANAGTYKTIGVEFTGRYRRNRLFSNLTVAWQHVLQSEIYMNDINDAFNIPKWTFNAVVGYDILKNLRVHGHVCVETEQTNYTLSMNAAKPQITSSKVPARAIVDLGVRYGLGRLEFGVNCHNLLNQKYYRGCFGAGLIRQPSFSVLGYVAVKI